MFYQTTEIKDYNVIIDEQNLFDQQVKNDLRKYDNIWEFTTGQMDDYTTGCLLDHSYFKDYNKIMTIDLRKQQALDADPKEIQQISFTWCLHLNTKKFSLSKNWKKLF